MLIITVKVVPNAKQSKIVLGTDNILKCYVQSVPEKGKANKELVQLFAKQLKVPRSSIEIIKGLTTRTKQVRIDTSLSYHALLEQLGLDIPGYLFD